jgi:hypothetical protein
MPTGVHHERLRRFYSLLKLQAPVDATGSSGELITLRGEPPAGLDCPGPVSGLPEVWRRIEAEAAAALGSTTIATLLPATTDPPPTAPKWSSSPIRCVPGPGVRNRCSVGFARRSRGRSVDVGCTASSSTTTTTPHPAPPRKPPGARATSRT